MRTMASGEHGADRSEQLPNFGLVIDSFRHVSVFAGCEA